MMGNLLSKLGYLKRCFRFYVDIPSIFYYTFFLAALLWIGYDGISDGVIKVLNYLKDNFGGGSVLENISLGAIASLIATVIWIAFATATLVPLRRFFFRGQHCGKFKAFDLQPDDNGNYTREVEWGEVEIRFSALAPDNGGIPVQVSLTHGDIELYGEGLMVNNKYLAGAYTEVGKPERLRSGSFMYTICGDGVTWSGPFVYIDPDNPEPCVGRAKWVRA